MTGLVTRVAHATVARIPLIKPATLILWYEQDRLLPTSYANVIAGAIRRKDQDQGHRT